MGTAGAKSVIALSVGVGVLAALLSLGMPGSGHGWYSALIGLVSLGLAPAAGAAWSSRGSRAGSVTAIIVLAAGVLADLYVVAATLSEGWSYMTNAGGMAVLWWCLFLSWQVLAVFALVAGRRAPAA